MRRRAFIMALGGGEWGKRSDPHYQLVILRESGGSSTPRLRGSITTASGILDRPLIGERKRRRPSGGYAGR